MKLMKTEDAVGQVLCHDITTDYQRCDKRCGIPQRPHHYRRRYSGAVKCRKGQHYIWEKDDTMLHENEAAQILYDMCKTITCIRPMSKKEKLN